MLVLLLVLGSGEEEGEEIVGVMMDCEVGVVVGIVVVVVGIDPPPPPPGFV